VLGVDIGGEEAAREALIDSLGRTRGWIVLDNCEHLLAAAADLVAESLHRAPGVRWLTTSQQPLHVAGEHVYRLDSLAVPAPGSALAQPPNTARSHAGGARGGRAPALRARCANIDAAIELCRQLDGIPLAIEMAAARVPRSACAACSSGSGRA